ncbi:hypothetical protein EDC96DRAFT_545347 [Choanephora cucurbitarum]|nr:hypothetical protein EDC96DRAFT_545347 [Choanephora cucurbitarum]
MPLACSLMLIAVTYIVYSSSVVAIVVEKDVFETLACVFWNRDKNHASAKYLSSPKASPVFGQSVWSSILVFSSYELVKQTVPIIWVEGMCSSILLSSLDILKLKTYNMTSPRNIRSAPPYNAQYKHWSSLKTKAIITANEEIKETLFSLDKN